MEAAQVGGGASRVLGGPAHLLRDDAGRLLHRRMGPVKRGWVLRRTGEEDGGWWPEPATRERRWRTEEGDGAFFQMIRKYQDMFAKCIMYSTRDI